MLRYQPRGSIGPNFLLFDFFDMRKLLAVAVTALVVLYGMAAFDIFIQERWVEDLPPVGEMESVRHPEAVLALAQQRFATNRYRDEELRLVRKAFHEAPSSYQPPFLLAMFRANRSEAPGKVRHAFDVAVSRYGANGRLQLAYGAWLLESRTSLEGWADPDDPGRLRDPLPSAERHLAEAMRLEPELTWEALRELARYRVAPRRWAALVPDAPIARTHLLDALFQAGELDAVWASLREGTLPADDPSVLRRIVHWGLDGKRPDVALDAALRWRALVEESRAQAKSQPGSRGAGSDLLEPTLAASRAYFALGDDEAAYELMSSTLEKVEAKYGTSSGTSLQFLCAMGEEYLNRGNIVTAESIFTQAVSASPTHVPGLVGLARTLKRSGDLEGALERYQEALRIDPSNDKVRQETRSLLLRLGAR
jgi:Tfp pilus assembly protein PilF